MDSPTLDRLPEQQETGLPGPLAAEGGLSVRLVSDYICPWCYIGRVRLERLRWELPLAIELWAFDLRPGLPPEGLPREAVYKETPERRERQQYLRSLAAEEGIALARPPIVPDTQRAHQATEYAKKQGKGLEFSLAVFRAYWRGEENIGELSVLTRLASEVGLDSLEL
ncbi:MAG TPA: DsbA family protein, partial [Dehalococcoidia bacterium]|nr:DsbA family protein [Dehalococcoidia bacterium]